MKQRLVPQEYMTNDQVYCSIMPSGKLIFNSMQYDCMLIFHTPEQMEAQIGLKNFRKMTQNHFIEFGEFEKSKRQCEAHYEFQGYHRS
jgi:hypothetical protein